MPIHRGPGREREPDVIERMVTKYIFTLNSQPEDCRDATLAMIAAVRVLEDFFMEGDKTTAAWRIRAIIQDHELRAGGKGE